MADWYQNSKALMTSEAVEETGLTHEQFAKAYAFLSEVGLIDYDTEKEILFDRYVDVDDNDDEERDE